MTFIRKPPLSVKQPWRSSNTQHEHFKQCDFPQQLLIRGIYSDDSSRDFSMTTCSPSWIAKSDPSFLHTFPSILTSFCFSCHVMSLDSHYVSTSVTSLLAPSVCPALAVGGVYRYPAVACVAVPQSFLLDVLSLYAWNCSLSSPKNNDRETPASLKLTVSFPASFL